MTRNYQVTQPITKYGRYYAAGEIYDADKSTVVDSLRRLHGWKKVAASATSDPGLAGKSKPELQALADAAGLDLPKKTSKRALIAALEA